MFLCEISCILNSRLLMCKCIERAFQSVHTSCDVFNEHIENTVINYYIFQNFFNWKIHCFLWIWIKLCALRLFFHSEYNELLHRLANVMKHRISSLLILCRFICWWNGTLKYTTIKNPKPIRSADDGWYCLILSSRPSHFYSIVRADFRILAKIYIFICQSHWAPNQQISAFRVW